MSDFLNSLLSTVGLADQPLAVQAIAIVYTAYALTRGNCTTIRNLGELTLLGIAGGRRLVAYLRQPSAAALDRAQMREVLNTIAQQMTVARPRTGEECWPPVAAAPYEAGDMAPHERHPNRKGA